MWHDAVLVAGKDLRIEARSRVGLWQVVPFALLVLVLLAFAIGPDEASLRHAAPGIFWVALLFSTVLAIQRSVAVESGEGTRDGLRLSGIDPAGIFLGKAAAVGLQLLALQVVLWAGVTFLFDVRVHVVWLAVAASLLATVGLACAGVLYGALSAGLRVRDTLLPLLVLPVLAPVLLAGSKVWQAALERQRVVGYPVAEDPGPVRRHLSRRGHRALRPPPGGGMNGPAVTSSRPRWLDVVGVLGVVAMGFTVWLGLWVTPPDVVQGNLARLLYIHPSIATVALYWVGIVAAGGSLLYLWPRTRSLFWDRLAASSVEVGAVFSALTLVTGSLWGRPVWGVWWTWDARLTSTALLLLLEIGYLALRRVPAEPAIRARRCAVAALLIAIDIPIVHFSVDWWNTLHQGGTVLDPGFDLHVHGIMLWTLGLSFVAFSLIFVWLLGVRYRVEVLQDAVGDQELEVSLAERWSEDTELVGVGGQEPPRGGEGTVSYVDAGYAVALATLFVYAVSLILRRRRWERALRVSEAPATEGDGAPEPGGRP